MPIQNLAARVEQTGQDLSDYLTESLDKPVNTINTISVDPLGAALTAGQSVAKGAVADLTSAANDLSNALQNPGALIGNAIGGALNKALGGALGGLIGGAGGFPKENVLSKYASYNCVFTLGVLSENEVNFPDSTYRKSGPSIIILRSGGTGNRQIKTAVESQAKTTGEYFIEDVEIDTLVASNPKTKQTNATNISFKVIEPYSMGIFLQSLQMAALRGGWKNYLEAPFLLQLEFVGWDDNGRPLNIPRSKRMFPLKLSQADFSVTGGGSEYNVVAIPWHEHVFSNEVQAVKTDADVKGATVLELLQTGPESLATILNNRELEQVKSGNKKVGNQYVILFPTEKGAEKQAIGSGSGAAKGATTASTPPDDLSQEREISQERKDELAASLTGVQNGKVPEDFDAELSKILGISIKRSNIGESIREFSEKPENINAIGNAKIVKSFLDSGKPYFGKPAFAVDKEKKGSFKRGSITVSDEGRRIQFKQNTKVQDIIEEIILLSDYARKFTTEVPDDKGMKTWFKIETDHYVIPNPENVTKTGESAKVFLFKVVPYKVHTSRLASPTQAPAGIPALKSVAMRRYDYIYTGKNDDILNFDINFNAAFYNSILGDYGQLGKSQKLGAANSTVAPEDTPKHGQADGNEASVPGAGVAPAKLATGVNTGGSGSGATNHPENMVARSFNDSIVNSTTDLVTVDLQIWGDPFYIADSGMGNYDSPTLGFNVTKDNTMEYQNGEIDVELYFRTPIDYGNDGTMKFPSAGSKAIGSFSGVYQVTTVKNQFNANKFTQTLSLIRRRNQEVEGAVDVGLESIIEKGLDAIISPLASAPAAAFAAAKDELSKALGGIGGIAGAAADLDQKLSAAVGDLTNALSGAINGAGPNIGAALKDSSSNLTSALSSTPASNRSATAAKSQTFEAQHAAYLAKARRATGRDPANYND